jgi:hypothetical protein
MKIKKELLMLAVLFFLIAAAGGCSGNRVPETETESSETFPEENRVFGEAGETSAVLPGEVTIEGLGSFSFEPSELRAVRDDIFREGHFSIFDVLVYLDQTGQISMDYEFDETMYTYVINSLDGRSNWWYDAYYDGGWREQSVFRMDHYPYKDKMVLMFVQVTEDYLESIYDTYRDEIKRKADNGGRLIIPEVVIKGRSETLRFENVEITAHNLRSDMFQEGVVTAIDTIITLGEAGEISYDLQWYESIGTAGIVKSYWVNRINSDESYNRCGFVYEAGNEKFRFFRGNHNHIPSDVRVINSPAYVEYFWICI